MTDEKQYILFAGGDYYPGGGIYDFILVGTMAECVAEAEDIYRYSISSYNRPKYDWAQIVDKDTLKGVKEMTHKRVGQIEWEDEKSKQVNIKEFKV